MNVLLRVDLVCNETGTERLILSGYTPRIWPVKSSVLVLNSGRVYGNAVLKL